MISLIDLSLQRGALVLLENINLTLFAGQKIGIIGKNGSGKTSLFAAFRGSLGLSTGSLQIPRGLRIAHLEQEMPASEMSAVEFVVAGDAELAHIEQAITQAEEKHDYEKLMNLHMKIADLDGYTARSRAAKILDDLGFDATAQEQPVNSFSGGYRMRLNMARCLMCPSDLLLLDEPTNHMDLETILWLEQWLKNYSGTLLIISHDRDFLDGVADHILHLENRSLKLYKGNYSDFELLRAATLAQQQAQYQKQQAKISHLQSFVDRFKAKASKAKQAQSRVRAIARLEKLAPLYAAAETHFEFLPPEKTGSPLIRLDKAAVGYTATPLLKNLNLNITGDARIGLLGKNGAGKTTFINLLMGNLPALSGQIVRHNALCIGYFAQHQIDHLQLAESAFDYLQSHHRRSTTQEIRNFLGGFNFQGNKIFDPIKNFSGGEKARLALAFIIWQRPNLLLLDEPTNHLDLEMREALCLALQSYAGALLIVSHDRHLLRSTVNELWLTQQGTIKEFSGDVQDYLQGTG